MVLFAVISAAIAFMGLLFIVYERFGKDGQDDG